VETAGQTSEGEAGAAGGNGDAPPTVGTSHPFKPDIRELERHRPAAAASHITADAVQMYAKRASQPRPSL
jgi:hypothetical protein